MRLVRAIKAMSPSTSRMISTWDYRALSRFDDAWTGTSRFEIYSIMPLMPNLRCLVMDRRQGFDLDSFAKGLEREWSTRQEATLHSKQPCPPPEEPALVVLSLMCCSETMPRELLSRQLLSGLIYLDLSSIVTGYSNMFTDVGALSSTYFPKLRILKVANFGLSSFKAQRLIFPEYPGGEKVFKLWSLDVSNNKLDDFFVDFLQDGGVCRDSQFRLQRDDYFEVEGKLAASEINCVYFVQESEWSGSYSHPLRYLADPPRYTEHKDVPDRPGYMDLDGEQKDPRHQGHEPIRGDTIEDAITVLAGGDNDPEPPVADWPARTPKYGPLTHIRLNGNDMSLMSIQNMLEFNCGYIEHFECDKARVLASPNERKEWRSRAPWALSGATLHGFSGSAYLFRPVISSNLRVLKIHHSLVTNTPTIGTDTSMFSEHTNILQNIWLAEKLFTASFDLAYPQRYEPDMNPRLYSLTLAKIPQYSTGIVTTRIIEFLKKLAIQEQAIEHFKKLFPHHRGPPFLRGLRHICLEFDHGAKKEMMHMSGDDDISQAMTEFSAFSSNTDMWTLDFQFPREPVTRMSNLTDTAPGSSSANQHSLDPGNVSEEAYEPLTDNGTKQSRLTTFPFYLTADEYYTESDSNLDVWIGNGILGPSNTPAVNAYMRNLAFLKQTDGFPLLTIATPCHIAAGVPAGSYLFRDAWDRIAIPSEGIMKPPTRGELAADLKDVEAEIKAFRLASREVYARLLNKGKLTGKIGEHEYYRGRVEISR